MMKNCFFGLCLTACIFILAGCSTFAKRAEEKASVFNTLPLEVQHRLENEDIRLGDTPDMVYIAFGNPDYKARKLTADTSSESWFYTGYYSRYRGQYIARYETRYSYDSKGNRYLAYSVPIWGSYYDDVPYLVRQFTFVDDKVTEIVE